LPAEVVVAILDAEVEAARSAAEVVEVAAASAEEIVARLADVAEA
jgi:hypothetical protein